MLRKLTPAKFFFYLINPHLFCFHRFFLFLFSFFFFLFLIKTLQKHNPHLHGRAAPYYQQKQLKNNFNTQAPYPWM
jgi:hypothetical protein